MSDVSQGDEESYESRARDLVELIVRGLVDRPDEIEVSEQIGERSIVVRVRAPEDEIGKVIGRGGRIANSLRLLAKAAAIKAKKSVWVDISKLGPEESPEVEEEQTQS